MDKKNSSLFHSSTQLEQPFLNIIDHCLNRYWYLAFVEWLRKNDQVFICKWKESPINKQTNEASLYR